MRLVLLHGFTGGAGTFAHLALDAVTPELPGHGKEPPAISWDDALDRLERFLDPGPVVLAGYSMGARLALALALRRPAAVARLVLASGTAGIDDDRARAERRAGDEELARFIEERGVAAFVERWERNPIVALPSLLQQQLLKQRLAHGAAGLASALRHLGPGAQPSYWNELAGLDVPVTLLAGARDEKFTALAERMRALLPRAELRTADCGHVIHLERPEIFRGALA
jgi:2-succinyl-6-hydroxy-2,4-cyclohexadiene-1-carboxylate synthase